MAKSKFLIPGGIFALLFVLISIFSVQAQTGTVSTINFEGIPTGTIVDSVSYGNGISGDPVSGFVDVFGLNPDFGPDTNAAMIFDATCPPGNVPQDCTGGDDDLFQPSEGKVLIISEDLDSSDPDDADLVGAQFFFDYSNLGPTGIVSVTSIDILDVETEEFGDAFMDLFGPGDELLAHIQVPETGNGQAATVPINIAGVGSMVVDLDGSGAITNVHLIVPEGPTATPTATNTPTATPTEPTAIKLLYFRIDGIHGSQVDLAWGTESEIDNYGFILYRAATDDLSQAAAIHFEPARGGLGGNSYTFTDTVPGSGEWYYWLADVDTGGSETTHGPVKATVPTQYAQDDFQIFMPLLVVK
jgi:hypothetical protein